MAQALILALVDDLMFTSKIRTAANRGGVTVTFARSSSGALEEMRKARPSLVILDLDNPRTDPLGTIAAMKADPELSTIRTVAYVSHVQNDLIQAARQAGVGEVLPRSAFSAQLPDLLLRV